MNANANTTYATLTAAAEHFAQYGISRNQIFHIYRFREKLGAAHAFASLSPRAWVRVNIPALREVLIQRGLIPAAADVS